MLWIFLAIVSVCVIVVILELRSRRTAKLANDWPIARGTVKNWKITEIGGESTTFQLTLQVQMEADGRTWISSIDAGDDFSSEEDANRCARELRPGPLLVYYDPKNPARGSLNRDPLSIAPRA